jgi:hypothetical protein
MLYEPILREALLAVGHAFAAATKTAPSTVARTYARDSAYFNRLRRGCPFLVATYDRVICAMARDWPRRAQWPPGVPRPSAEDIARTLDQPPKE